MPVHITINYRTRLALVTGAHDPFWHVALWPYPARRPMVPVAAETVCGARAEDTEQEYHVPRDHWSHASSGTIGHGARIVCPACLPRVLEEG